MQSALAYLCEFLIGAMVLGPSVASAAPDFSPFDPARIGLPALTDSGVTYLIDQHRQAIKQASDAIAEVKAGHSVDGSALSNAAEVIARYEEDIQVHIDAINRLTSVAMADAIPIAERGNISDLPKLQEVIAVNVAASRQNALLGNNAAADQKWKETVHLQATFAAGFKKSCSNQSFDRDYAYGIERQDELLGNGIEVTACANREMEAKVQVPPGLPPGLYTWRHCGIGMGEWKLVASGRVFSGKGTGTTNREGQGPFSVNFTSFGGLKADLVEKGTLNIHCDPAVACNCARNPTSEGCKAKYGTTAPPTVTVLDSTDTSFGGKVIPPPPMHPFPVPMPVGPFGGEKSIPVEVHKIDRPCNPETFE